MAAPPAVAAIDVVVVHVGTSEDVVGSEMAKLATSEKGARSIVKPLIYDRSICLSIYLIYLSIDRSIDRRRN
jgi:hypothetical protein